MKFWYTIDVLIPFQTNGMFYVVIISHVHTIKSGWSIVYIVGSQVIISKNIVFLSVKINFVLANSADPDEMSHFLMQDTVIYEKASRRPDVNGGRRVNEL